MHVTFDSRRNVGGLPMRNGLLAVAAIAAAFLLDATADRASAMMSATPTELGLATSGSSLVAKAALVCGRFGCRRVWRGPRIGWGARRVWWGARRFAWSSRAWWAARRVAWRSRWWGTRAAWGSAPLFAYAGAARPWGWSRPLVDYAGPAPSWGWSSPGVTVASWGWGTPGWSWSSPGVSVASWGWSSPGWGWRRSGWGWNDW